MDCSTIFAKNLCTLVTLPLKLLASCSEMILPSSGRNWLKKVDHQPNESKHNLSQKNSHTHSKQASEIRSIKYNLTEYEIICLHSIHGLLGQYREAQIIQLFF